MSQIPGYLYGSETVAPSPVSLADLRLLQETVLLTDEDTRYLRMAADVLEPQIEAVLDVWYGFVGSHPYLLDHFRAADGQPSGPYLEAVRKRFGQWIRDTCRADYGQTWLDYQHEIALRHSVKKNRTDGVQARTAVVPLRYMIAFIYPITATIRPFLARGGHPAEDVEKMHQAWFKSVVLQVALWSQPYVRDGMY